MTLIKSISGIRGTIGGKTGEGLTPLDIVKFSSAYGTWMQQTTGKDTIIIGRDARLSGEMINNLVCATLQGLGINIIDVGLSTTPTVEMMVPIHKAGGGIILTASHNPKEWNALKLLNQDGEFISDKEGKLISEIAEKENFEFARINNLGKYHPFDDALTVHIKAILNLPLVDAEAIRNRNFSIAIDCVNSSGGVAIPMLLEALGVTQIEKLFCEPNGHFPHNPEPLPEHLHEISHTVVKGKHDLGIVVDPDVDRLALVNEDGSMFGEEYTLVAVADYVLQHTKGSTVSNLSSTKALSDVTARAGGKHFAAAVGEVNVVKAMKAHKAVIGGEGNGGVIYPAIHYGRDALVGIALFLSHLAKSRQRMTDLRTSYPDYYISKQKITLTSNINVDGIFHQMQKQYAKQPINNIDGVKIEFEQGWVHLRKSNTEPIIRIYAESNSKASADRLALKIMEDIKGIAIADL